MMDKSTSQHDGIMLMAIRVLLITIISPGVTESTMPIIHIMLIIIIVLTYDHDL